MTVKIKTLSPADVRASICGREPGPYGPHLQAAKGQDPGDTRGLRPTVSGVSRAITKADTNLPQVLPANAQVQGAQRMGTCE